MSVLQLLLEMANKEGPVQELSSVTSFEAGIVTAQKGTDKKKEGDSFPTLTVVGINKEY